MRFLPFFILAALGVLAALFLFPLEKAAANSHLIGFPNADERLHAARPWVLASVCFIPALGALWYAFASILDRYLFRRTLAIFLLISFAFFTILVLFDIPDSLPEIRAAQNPWSFVPAYLTIKVVENLVRLLPFTVLLALLHTLSQFSSNREIVAFTQSGRGIFRLLAPLAVLGSLLSLLCLVLNYQVSPLARGYREAMLESISRGSTSQATNVLYPNTEDGRMWLIGRFPYDLSQNEPLRDVEVTTLNPDGSLRDRLKAASARWDRNTGTWFFTNPHRLILQVAPTPAFEPDLPEVLEIKDWSETPSMLIQQGLDARELGVPGLHDWLADHPEPTPVTSEFQTQFHYRFAQPWLCLITVLLAAPLGISFSRRGAGGTVVLAIILSALMLFCAEVFLAFGDSGELPAIPSAWATNLIFALLALVMIQRRFSGRPIFQTFAKWMGN